LNDYGTDLLHPDLDDASRIILGVDFVGDGNGVQDKNGHGTHVAGIIGAESNNGIGVAGVNWNCKLLISQVFDSQGNSAAPIVKNAIIYSTNQGCQVINFSGGRPSPSNVLHEAVQYAYDRDKLLVFAAGNDNGALDYPAAYSSEFSNVIAVGATDNNDGKSSFSDHGPELCVVAPGGADHPFDENDIYSTSPCRGSEEFPSWGQDNSPVRVRLIPHLGPKEFPTWVQINSPVRSRIIPHFFSNYVIRFPIKNRRRSYGKEGDKDGRVSRDSVSMAYGT